MASCLFAIRKTGSYLKTRPFENSDKAGFYTPITISSLLNTVVINGVEEDAKNVLKYMASNGLVANAKKTSFLLLNVKQCDQVQCAHRISGSKKGNFGHTLGNEVSGQFTMEDTDLWKRWCDFGPKQ